MTYHQKFTQKHSSNLEKVCEFLCEHGKALAKAANKLNGPAASARVFLLCESVLHSRRLTRAQNSQLVDFHRLLTLQQIGASNQTECSQLLQIDPSSEFVEHCCLLSEKLAALLKLILEGEKTRDYECNALQKVTQVS